MRAETFPTHISLVLKLVTPLRAADQQKLLDLKVCYFYTFDNEHILSEKLPRNVTNVTATSVNMRRVVTQYLTLDCFHSFLKGQFEAGPEINVGLG